MKMVTYTQKLQSRIIQLLSIYALVLCNFTLIAQDCPLVCNDTVQVSINYACEADLYPDLLLEGQGADADCNYSIVVYDGNNAIIAQSSFDENGTPADYTDDILIAHPIVNQSMVDANFSIGVFESPDPNANNCWSVIKVEDKIAPNVNCLDSISVGCNVDINLTSLTTADSQCAASINAPTVTSMSFAYESCAMEWELIDSVVLRLYTNPLNCDVSGLEFALSSSPIGVGTFTFQSGLFVSHDFDGIQAKDLDDNWVIDEINAALPGCVSVTKADLIIYSTSFYSYSYDENCDQVIVEITDDKNVELDCREVGAKFTMQRDIDYTVSDLSGNDKDCTLSIFYEKRSIDDILMPEDVIVRCSEDSNDDGLFDYDVLDVNGNGVFDATEAEAGVPTLDGNALYPEDDDNFCKFNITFTDESYDLCGSTHKIHRTWLIFDWCEAVVREHLQTIKLIDDLDPVVVCPTTQTIEVNSNPNTCLATFEVDPLNLSHGMLALQRVSDCSNNLSAEVFIKESNEFGLPDPNTVFTSDKVTANADGTFTITNVEGPRVWIQYVIYDGCGGTWDSQGSQFCALEVDIIDTKPPHPVCDQFISVTLGPNGWGRVYAISIDDGSFDNCDEHEDLTFQIRRAGGPVCFDPELAATGHNDLVFNDFTQFCCNDLGSGNIMVELEVSDVAGNSAVCMTFISVQDKQDPVVETCPNDAIVNCSNNPGDIDPSKTNGYPTFTDNCPINTPYPIDSLMLDDCGRGTIDRHWYVKDLAGTDHFLCTQIITVRPEITFGGDHIGWPDDRVLDTCLGEGTDPEDLGDYPIYIPEDVAINEAGICANITYTHEDQVFENVEGYCYKIVRTWTVLDWCVYKTTDVIPQGIYTETQVIKLSNNNVPTILTCGANESEYCIDQGTFENPICDVNIVLEASAADFCSKEVITNKLSYHYVVTSTTPGASSYEGYNNIVDEDFTVGEYIITWTVTDICGNTKDCSFPFSVKDCKNPSPYCIGKLTTTIMETTETVQIWAEDFNLKSDDECASIEFSFSTDVEDKSANFGCINVGENPVRIYVTDGNGNQDYCDALLIVQANGDVCDGEKLSLAGSIKTDNNEAVESVEVMLENMDADEPSYLMTGENGQFSFNNMTLSDYMIQPTKEDSYLNGVSTLDIVMIQRHILGLENLDSPYKLIAADVNNSSSVSASDLSEIRRLILGVTESFDGNNAWRFVDAEYEFVNPAQPWDGNEEIMLYNIETSLMHNDFVAVKVGDVNNSAYLSANAETDNRSNNTMMFEIVTENNNVKIVASENYTISGIQFTILMDNAEEVETITSDVLNITSANYSLHDLKNNHITFSWDSSTSTTISKGDALVVIEGNVSNVLLSSDITRAEAYDADFNTYEVQSKLEISSNQFGVYQNTPNPFSNTTNIAFNLPEAGDVTLRIMDVNGKLITIQKDWYNYGYNVIEVSLEDNAQGVLYYQIETATNSAIRKMISIK